MQRVSLLLCAAVLGFTLAAGTPAHAQVLYNGNQMVVTGTVSSMSDNVVTIATPTGYVSLPVSGTVFMVDGYRIGWPHLYVGEAIQATSYNNYSYQPDGWYDANGNFHVYRHQHDDWDIYNRY